MEFAGEYVLTKVLALTESIARRAFQKAGEQANSRFGTMNDVMTAVEKETTQILDCLASQQQSKVDSAYQYIKFAMADLQAWNEELLESFSQRTPSYQSSTSLNSQNPDTASYVSQLTSSPNFTVSVPVSSKYFRDAIWQLRQADEWATEAFNDRRNSKAYVRMEALHIRLFCRSLLDWDNKRLWFSKWRQVLEPFFSDRQFVRYTMGEQSFTSKLFSEERAKPVSQRFIRLTKCLEILIWNMIMKEPWLIPYAREFAIYFDRNTTLAPDIKLISDWAGLRTFHLSYYDLNEHIELKICANKLIIRLYEFKTICPMRNCQIWAVEHEGRLVTFDARNPANQTLVTDGEQKKWISIGYAREEKKVYGIAEGEREISVFDGETGKEIENETYPLPAHNQHAYAYQLTVTSGGIIFLRDKGNGRCFIYNGTSAGSPDWTPSGPEESEGPTDQTSMEKMDNVQPDWMSLGVKEYDEILQGANGNELIGLKIEGSFLIAEVIRKVVKNGKYEVSLDERYNQHLPHEPQKYFITTVNDEITTDQGSPIDHLSRIIIVYQMEKTNCIVDVQMEIGENGILLSILDVNKFPPEYTDWEMAREMIEGDGKLFMLFR